MLPVKEYYGKTPGPTQKFGAPRGKRKHRGLDISWSKTPGTPVPALLGGKVIGILAPADWHGFGHQVTTRVEFGSKIYDVSYAHGRTRGPLGVGSSLAAGQKVLEEGTTGATNGSCMHEEVFDRALGIYIDPHAFNKRVLAAGAPAGGLKPTQRLVTSASLNRRRTPDRKHAPLAKPLKRGTVGNFVGWKYGEKVGGNNVWFQGTSGNWFHSGGLDGGARTTGLKDLNPKSSTATRTVRALKGSTTINGRSQPKTSAPVRQKLKRGATGTFNGYRRGQRVTQNGVTSDIWFRGAFNGNWFWAGNFTSQSTSGLPKV